MWVGEGRACTPRPVYGDEGSISPCQFILSTFTWVLGVRLRSPGLCGKHLLPGDMVSFSTSFLVWEKPWRELDPTLEVTARSTPSEAQHCKMGGWEGSVSDSEHPGPPEHMQVSLNLISAFMVSGMDLNKQTIKQRNKQTNFNWSSARVSWSSERCT